MIKREEIIQALDKIFSKPLLQKAAVKDDLPNGIQIKGNPSVHTVALGVSCSDRFISEAVKSDAQMVICHHGLYTGGDIYKGRFDVIESRLKTIIKHDITLAGYHYCLDAHSKIGNNVQLINLLGASQTGEAYFDEWGYVGEYKVPITHEELKNRLEKVVKHEVFTVSSGPELIKRIGVCSGSAKPRAKELFEIIDHQIDAHITGEISESGPHSAEAVGFTYFACGHYATETFGIKALGQELTKIFKNDLAIKFIDVPASI